jgi:Flp pilus assembly protein CpaB
LNKKTLIAIIIGLATCVTSVYFLFQYAANYQQLIEIVVPKRDIAAFEQLTEENLGIKKVPLGSVDNTIAVEPSQILGKTTTVPLFSGEQIRLERLVDKRIVDVNKHQVAVNVNLTRSVAGTLKEGDIVDVYWVADNDYTTEPIARNCIVLKVTDGQGIATTKPSQQSSSALTGTSNTVSLPAVVLLAVNPREVPRVVKGSADKSIEIVLVKKLKEDVNNYVSTTQTKENPANNVVSQT